MDKITAKVAKLSTSTLKDMATKLFVDPREGSEIVFSAILSALETRLPEAEFVAFCEGM